MTALDGIRERLAAATPGPWKAARRGDFQSITLHGGSLWLDIVDGSHTTGPHGDWIDSPDIDLIEQAPTDIARLLRAVEAVEKVADDRERRGFPSVAQEIRAALAKALGD